MEKSQYIMKMSVDLNDWFDIVNDINNDDINKEYSFASFGIESSFAKHLLKPSSHIS